MATRRQFMHRLPAAVAVVAGAARGRSMAGQLLIPMDRDQSNHLKAYGVTYRALQRGERGEWLLNYRSGSFLFLDSEAIRREAALNGVEVAPVSDAQVASIRAEIEKSNMDTIPLEKAPKVAVYTEPDSKPWDDAVTIALEYAGIGYDRLWDPEVIGGKLADYEWLHLHHEDFTGQYSKFYITYTGVDWLQEEVRLNQDTARGLGFADVPALKKGVADKIRTFVDKGGFLFAMCTATETLDLALAAGDTDIAARFADGTPIDPNASKKMHWERALAFQNAQVQTSEAVNAFSDIDGHQVNTPWRLELGAFTLFDFSAKFDPVPSMLTQCHESVIPDFYGLTTSFRLDRLKPATIVLAKEGELAKYVHGDLGEGTFTYLGGHDPEDPEHEIGNAPTDLSLHPNSPGYRLILNNVLFPAAKKKKLKT